MRVAFDEVFQVNADGSISPREPVHIGGTTMRPGISLSSGGISVGGVYLSELKGKDLEIEKRDGTVVIKGSYGKK